MFRKIINNTTMIQQKLKAASRAITVYPDGISCDEIGSLRLSNTLNNMKWDITTSLKILFLFAYCVQGSSQCYGQRPSAFKKTSRYFSSPNQEHNYRFDSIGGIEIAAEECHTVRQHAIAYPYEEASDLYTLHRCSSQLFRGAGELIDQTIEECLTDLINQQITHLQSEREVEMYFIGSMMFLIIIFFLMLDRYNEIKERNNMDSMLAFQRRTFASLHEYTENDTVSDYSDDENDRSLVTASTMHQLFHHEPDVDSDMEEQNLVHRRNLS